MLTPGSCSFVVGLMICAAAWHPSSFRVPAFGRQQRREHSRHYLPAPLVQSQERRNAENPTEMVPVSARALQRFLPDFNNEARWVDAAVIDRLQEYLGPPLAHQRAVWVFDGSDFPKQGVKSGGVTRQYCGALGKVVNCQDGVFLACRIVDTETELWYKSVQLPPLQLEHVKSIW